MRIDVHSHVSPPEVMGKAGRYGPERWIKGDSTYTRVGDHISSVKLDPELVRKHGESADMSLLLPGSMAAPGARLVQMDERGIDIMGVTIPPLFYLYWAEPEIGVPFACAVNDALSAYCESSDGRLFVMATLPLQDIDASVAEVDRAVGELGAKSINIGGTNLAGRELDDAALFPIYERIQAHDVPIFLHPYPDHLAVGGTVKDDYNLSWITGYTYQETVAFCRFILGGVLDEFPKLKIYITHGGGFAPYQWGRLVKFAPYMPGVKTKKPLRDYLQNFYFDLLLHDRRERRFCVDFIGADNVVFGSNYGSPQDQADFSFLEGLGLDEEAVEKITGGNAMKLFKLTPANIASESS